MTMPDERYRAVVQTAKFLQSLSYSSEIKRVPLAVRQQARSLLRHYPSEYDMKKTSQTSPDVFQERMEEVTRLFKQYEQSQAEKNET
jgi:predicted nuclease with TOPRIM domain